MKEKKDKNKKHYNDQKKGNPPPGIKDLDFNVPDSQDLGQQFRELSIETENYGEVI